MEVPSTDAAASVVYLRHKRYHPLYTLQTQGRMHVQMKVLNARAADGEATREPLRINRRSDRRERG